MKLGVLAIEITNACNLKCNMCGNASMQRKRSLMEWDLFRETVDNAAECGVFNIHLHTVGEPLLHPQCVEMVRYVREKNIACWIATNGMLLTPETSQQFLEADLNALRFSIEGSRSGLMTHVRSGADIEQIYSNLKTFKNLRDEGAYKTHIGINTIVMKSTLPDLGSFTKKWKPLCDDISFSLLGSQAQDNAFSKHEVIYSDEGKERCACNLFKNKLSVSVEGNVSACCVDFENEMVVGHIKDGSLDNTFNGEAMQHLRSLHNSRQFDQLDMCKICSATYKQSDKEKKLLNSIQYRYLGLFKGKTKSALQSLMEREIELNDKLSKNLCSVDEMFELLDIVNVLGTPEETRQLISSYVAKRIPFSSRLLKEYMSAFSGDAFHFQREQMLLMLKPQLSQQMFEDLAYSFDIRLSDFKQKQENQLAFTGSD